MLRLTTEGGIQSPSDSSSGDPDPSIFIQCVNGREPMVDELWFHGLDGLSRDVHPTARVELPTGDVREFIIDYLTPDRRRNIIIGKCSVNGSLQFTGFPEIWDSGLPYISNDELPDATRGWGRNGTDRNSFTAAIKIPGFTGNWGSTINAIPDNSPRSPVCYLVVHSRNRNNFLYCRRLERLWSLYTPRTGGQIRLVVCASTRLRQRIQHREFLVSNTDLPATQ